MRFTLFSTALLTVLATFGSTDASHSRRRLHTRRSGLSSAAVSVAESLNKPAASAGTPSSDFAAKSSIPAVALAAAALKLKKAATKYQIDQGSKTWSTIYEDWDTGKNVRPCAAIPS